MSHQASLYYHTGSLDGISMRGNKYSFRKCRIVPRVMRNVSSVRPQTTIFGLESALPIYISPSSNAMLGHPDGELNMTRGVNYLKPTRGASLSAGRKDWNCTGYLVCRIIPFVRYSRREGATGRTTRRQYGNGIPSLRPKRSREEQGGHP